ncbi:hypothetical protein PGT21_025623 [Puccinia graminis f. sp. tritici]|uniref:Uncharacterized protein n=1 Tax=Puccinia graminis f. sp. tritici TaxID=56615 RepID=A0A5B0M165_PUCGR|nr:hypothetical protein PGT21_025623 [Puccinia graminis f. sp. tritici]
MALSRPLAGLTGREVESGYVANLAARSRVLMNKISTRLPAPSPSQEPIAIRLPPLQFTFCSSIILSARMSSNPNNNLLSTAAQMKRNNANLAKENAEDPTEEGPDRINPHLNPNLPTHTQSNPVPTNTNPIPIPPKPKNPATAKAPIGSNSHQTTTKSTAPPNTSQKHPMSLEEVASSAERHRQPGKQAKDLTAILGAKTIDVEKEHMERTIATNAALR